MSRDVKPLVFRTLEGRPVVPSWLRHASQQQVAPLGGPFARVQDQRPDEGRDDGQQEPEPLPSRQLARESAPPGSLRRSSLPPRMSAPPPPVIITRPPPHPQIDYVSEAPPPPVARITPAEQEAFAHAALELASLRARVLSNAEAELLELSVSIAELLIEDAIERVPSLHNALARAAVAALGDTRAAKLRVSRAAFRAITELHGEEAVDVDGVRVELTLDNSLEGLSVIAESGASRVDGRVRERLAAVLRALLADHRQKGAEGDE